MKSVGCSLKLGETGVVRVRVEAELADIGVIWAWLWYGRIGYGRILLAM